MSDQHATQTQAEKNALEVAENWLSTNLFPFKTNFRDKRAAELAELLLTTYKQAQQHLIDNIRFVPEIKDMVLWNGAREFSVTWPLADQETLPSGDKK
jgi:hypothetical protein